MKIAEFGAIGGLGSRFPEVSLNKGHQVIVYVRSSEKIQSQGTEIDL